MLSYYFEISSTVSNFKNHGQNISEATEKFKQTI